METISENKMFGGTQAVYSHRSEACDCDMRVSVFLPPQAKDGPCLAVVWLSGLTCTEENFTVKAGAQRIAAILRWHCIDADTRAAHPATGPPQLDLPFPQTRVAA